MLPERLSPALVRKTDGARKCRSGRPTQAPNHNDSLTRKPYAADKRMVERHRLARPTSQTTIKAVMYCIHERGLAFDGPARAEVNRRIAKLEEDRSSKVSQNVP
jgi:hypothetical protein